MGLPNGPNAVGYEACAGSYSLDNLHTISGYSSWESSFLLTCTWTEMAIHVNDT
jgi:hypothetical protein